MLSIEELKKLAKKHCYSLEPTHINNYLDKENEYGIIGYIKDNHEGIRYVYLKIRSNGSQGCKYTTWWKNIPIEELTNIKSYPEAYHLFNSVWGNQFYVDL